MYNVGDKLYYLGSHIPEKVIVISRTPLTVTIQRKHNSVMITSKRWAEDLKPINDETDALCAEWIKARNIHHEAEIKRREAVKKFSNWVESSK